MAWPLPRWRWRSSLVALLLVRGASTHEYDAAVPERRPARQGRRRPGRRPPHRLGPRRSTLTDDNQARGQRSRVEEPYAPLREGTHGRDPPDLAVGHRQPLHRADARARTRRKELDDGATLTAGSTTARRRPRPALQHARPEDAQGPAGRHPGLRHAVRGQGRGGRRGGQVLQPVRCRPRAGSSTSSTAGRGALTDFIVNSSRAVTALAERRDDLAALVGNTNATAARDRARERRARPGARAAADHAAARQHDVREPARDARRPRRARRRVQAGDQGPRAVPARAAPARARARSPTIHDLRRLVTPPGPDNDLIDATRKMPGAAAGRHARRSSTRRQALVKSQPVLEFIRPYTPELVGWFRDFGQGAANYDANGHFARIQPIFNAFPFTDNPAGGVLAPSAAERSASTACRPRRQAAARAPRASPRRTARRRTPTTATSAPTTATRARCRRALMKRVATVAPPARRSRAAAVRDHRRRRRRQPTRCARSSTTPAS